MTKVGVYAIGTSTTLESNKSLAGLRQSRDFVATNREYFNRARAAVMAKITEHEAAAALAVTQSPLLAASSSNVPDLDRAHRTAQ